MEQTKIGLAELETIEKLDYEISKAIIGQRQVVRKVLSAMLAGGHVLLEGAPGLAKTTLVKTLADVVSCQFSRIQFTPDLMPSDLTGSMVYNPKSNDFAVRKGPIFANFILADEINRSPAKVQSALLEAMQEQQVTIAESTYKLPEPFWVLATQNPIEQEGTYRLPEAQADRFIFKLKIDFPSIEDELKIAQDALAGRKAGVSKVLSLGELANLKAGVAKVYVDEKIQRFVANIVFATRKSETNKITRFIRFGASPRGTISLLLAARAYAFINGRNYVVPDDIYALSKDVLRHRIGLSFEAIAENISSDDLITEIFTFVKSP